MKVLITGGGTAGHVTPLLAVATELKSQYPDSHIRYVGQAWDPMRHLIINDPAIEKSYNILAGKWRRYHGIGLIVHLKDIKTMVKNLRDLVYFVAGFFQSLAILIMWRPQVIFVKGGFVGLPVGLAGALLRIPMVTHDSDSLPGLTNRILSRFAKLQAVGMPVDVYKAIYNPKKLRFTGIPIRPEFNAITEESKAEARKSLGISKNSKVILVTGGSLGAVRLNEAFLTILPELIKEDITINWVTGFFHHQQVKSVIDSMNLADKRLRLFTMTSKLDQMMAAADIVLTRAGATSIAELAAAGKATILVPNPYLTGGHQTKNAAALASEGAVKVVSEHQIKENPDILHSKIKELLMDEALRMDLGAKLHSLAVPDAAVKIVAVLNEAQG